MPSVIVYPLLMLVAGIGIPVMATLNSGLGVKLGSSALATTVLFFAGLVVSLFYLLQSGGLRPEGLVSQLFRGNIAWYFYLGGTLIAFYVLSVTWVAPQYGLGNAISFVLLGQLLAISIIDHFGLLGAPQATMNSGRAIGIVLMMVGVFLVIKRA